MSQQYNLNNIIFSSTYNPKKYEVFGIDRSNSHQLQSNGINIQELNNLIIELNDTLNNYYKEINKDAKTLRILWLVTFLLFLPTLGLILFIMMPILIILQFKYGQSNANHYTDITVPTLKRLIEDENLKYNQLGLNIMLNFDTDYTVVTNYRRVHNNRGHGGYRTRPVRHTVANRYVQLIITMNGNNGSYYGADLYQQANNGYSQYGTVQPQQQQTNSYYYQKL
ncbi:predicted protein [Naegleria gruberi]|uniref:Predicted protein n=1 Tax=Naegleria gruberi TaxID=5762 RepID=D2V5V1_NAEGR|nr:uncharacterized protein NAEGRDRAFT_64212 [Naegleria gruberi]EFC47861.1 predicted protein [Naegleria gruberi]|eukprot:XP_002680605.1 predicted protein [Naegleria gruberi strain NEG-M]